MSHLHQLEMKPSFFLFYILISFDHRISSEVTGRDPQDVGEGDKNLAFSTLSMFKIVAIQFADMKGKNGLE